MFSIIIPNYNGKEFLADCLSSLPKNLEVIVIDNSSTDGSVEYLKKKEIKLIENKKNLGFAKAVNQGILAAKNNYVVAMNNDLRVEKNWFKVMTEAIKRWQNKEKVGAYFGKVLDWDGKRIESTGLIYWLKGKAFNRGNGEIDSANKYNKEEFIFGASASMVVYYKPALLKIGLFDEDFFAYEEDVDLALRLKEIGWRTLYVPKAISCHLGGATSKRMANFRQRMDTKNWWFIIIKNYPISILIKHGPEILIERIRNLSGLIKATPWSKIPWVIIRTYGEILLKLPKMFVKRKPLGFLENYKDEIKN